MLNYYKFLNVGGLALKPVKMLQSAWNGWKTGRYVHAVYHGKLRENVILLESKNAKDLAGNIYRLLEVLTGEDYAQFEVYLSVRKECEASIRKLTKQNGITNYKIVYYESRKYYRLLATAKYLVEDTSFPEKFIKRKDQIYLNTWHGTPLKLMGRDEALGAYAIGNVQKNFFCADYLLYPNEYMKEKMFSAYMLDELYKGSVIYEGYPRNAVFFDEEKRNSKRRELGIEDKQVIVYMPTWRGRVTNPGSPSIIETVEALFEVLDNTLTDNQVFYAKFHVFTANAISFEKYKHIKPFPSGCETYELLNTADVLVTDYSSVFFDFANTGRKIILYPYDFDTYIGSRGLYTELDSLPFPKVYTAEALAEELNRPKEYDDTEFLENYCRYDNKDAAVRLAKQVFLGEDVCEVKKYSECTENGRKKILVFSSSLDHNGITASLLNLMKEADKEKNSYYFTFFQNGFRRVPHRLQRLPEGLRYLPINGTVTDLTLMELIAFKLYYGLGIDTPWVYRYVRRLYEREYKKHFAGAEFDGVIHFTGYSKEVTLMLSTAPCKKVIFVHSDMLREVATRNNHHIPTLRHAYHEYDVVVPVSESVRRAITPLADESRLFVIENTHDDAGVKEKAKQDIVLNPETLMNVSEERLREILEDDTIEKFINVGRFSPEKGHIKLLDAFERYYKEHPQTALVIIGGNGVEYRKTEEYVKGLACADSVVLIRALSNPFAVMKYCKLFLLASEYEAFGLVLLEAESMGIPSISTDVVGSGEFLKSQGGYVVENSADGLYRGMCAYREGKVHTLGIDFANYNKASVEKFDRLFDE